MAAQLLEHRVGQRLAGRVPAPRAEVVLGACGTSCPSPAVDRVEDLQALGDDLGADAVAADDGEVDGVGGRGVSGHVSQPRESLVI